jgi:hypothetical protein
VLAAAIYFHPSLIFAGKARSLPLQWIPIRCSTLTGSWRGLYNKFLTMLIIIAVMFTTIKIALYMPQAYQTSKSVILEADKL